MLSIKSHMMFEESFSDCLIFTVDVETCYASYHSSKRPDRGDSRLLTIYYNGCIKQLLKANNRKILLRLASKV